MLKNAVLWDMAPCTYCINRRFGERIASIFRVEEKRINLRARNQHEQVTTNCLLTLIARWLIFSFLFYLED